MTTTDQVLTAIVIGLAVCILSLCWSLQQAHHRLDELELDLEALLDQWTDDDSCMPLDVDGETIRVHGSGEWDDQDREAMAEIVRAAQHRMEAGRCGEAAPYLVGSTPVHCRLTAGHPGWHKGDNGNIEGVAPTEWSRT